MRKEYLWLGIGGFVFFVVVGVGSAYAFTVNPPANHRVPPHMLVGAIMVFWSFWACGAVWTLLAYWRERLSVEGQRIIQQKLIAKRDLDLSAVTALEWRFWNRSILLRTATSQMKIHFEDFEPHERLWLIRFLEAEVSKIKQDGWEQFCYRVANPLRRKVDNSDQALKADEVRINRRRWDWYFLPTTSIAALFGTVAGLWLDLPRMFAAPLLPILYWLGIRLLTPTEGIPARKMQDREIRTAASAIAEIGAIAVVAVIFLKLHPSPKVLFAGLATMFIWCVHFCYRHDATARRRIDRSARASSCSTGMGRRQTGIKERAIIGSNRFQGPSNSNGSIT